MTSTTQFDTVLDKGGTPSGRVTPLELRGLLLDGGELAVFDVRETGVHSRDGHILLSGSLPLSHLELSIASLVPRRQTRIVLYDGGDNILAERAAKKLAELGYGNISILSGGTAAWREAGYELFTGVNVIGKAFGEFVEHFYSTPHLSVSEVKSRIDAGDNIVVLDSRTLPEFQNFSIPGAIALPGAELVYRFHEVVKDPNSLVVVNCAGRTRSIIGAQALIDAGVPNKVASLENGTMAWLIEGLELDSGKSNFAPLPTGSALQEAIAAANRLKARFGLKTIDKQTLKHFQNEQDAGVRTLYLLDVRGQEEFAAGHLPGSRLAPGGQLVQQTGQWVGSRNSRIVLVDNADGVRSAITAAWLVRINWAEVYILEDALTGELVTGAETVDITLPNVETIDPATLHQEIENGSVIVIDLDTSLNYERGHIPKAYFAIRSRLADDAARLPGDGSIILTSSDGKLAAFAAVDLAAATHRPVRVVAGGTTAWRNAGLPLETGAIALLHPFEDIWRTPYQYKEQSQRFAAFREYLDWEIELVNQLNRDGTANFRTFAEDKQSV
ncbi:rhodanese-like domain protein [Nostoc carneum NIES-2107]|nr:rhodanese-like domain protein [Nostoc carneum NIES-2107]